MARQRADAPTVWADNDASKRKVIEAAVACFGRFGPKKTSMADVAQEAGISRKTLYRIFEDRPAMVEAVMEHRLGVLGRKLRRRFARYTTIEQALVEGSIASIAAGRSDGLFNEIVQQETDHRLEQFLFRGNERILDAMRATWEPFIELGRQDGKVREGLSNARIVEIIVGIHALLFMRDDYGPKEQRAFLEDVLVAAVVKQ